ncbi:V2 protein [Mulberry mosaic dwarf associated virus]|uniref:V2 protein n=1 Tax=Mulberry mosaic dwarf associated virus TaxID=1631303 RepID=A0A0D5BTW9_9GEMI|nr:V2 protein [Mulberry mosaic dwarf associated virus]AJW66418.1 V2 protein [Mulberry mosaic dwarf associated virus]AJW66423.1 V2 protein [Mulberry mosaic dwarf associated virus]AJW66433.1 V2 protein [Mulberry mosaic dwarf associated virus]AJW66438.1 V2 protein [Mulberry mosaic dwarf associated virus]AJW66443.1 V2 protein [Mulberry mosaic dwarf associated virus]
MSLWSTKLGELPQSLQGCVIMLACKQLMAMEDQILAQKIDMRTETGFETSVDHLVHLTQCRRLLRLIRRFSRVKDRAAVNGDYQELCSEIKAGMESRNHSTEAQDCSSHAGCKCHANPVEKKRPKVEFGKKEETAHKCVGPSETWHIWN